MCPCMDLVCTQTPHTHPSIHTHTHTDTHTHLEHERNEPTNDGLARISVRRRHRAALPAAPAHLRCSHRRRLAVCLVL